MSNEVKRQRRRAALSCTECRRKKQRCDRKLPCEECVTRGIKDACRYEKPPTRNGADALLSPNPPRQTQASPGSTGSSPHPHHPFSNEDGTFTSMGLLKTVITDLEIDETQAPPSNVPYQYVEDRQSQLYFGFVRRIPPGDQCERLFRCYFAGFNNLQLAVEEGIFREQLQKFWSSAYEYLPKHGLSKMDEELRSFPAVLFQVLALAVSFLPANYDKQLDQLRFGPSQTFSDLSREYSECGNAIAKLLGQQHPTFLAVQHSLLRDLWLCHIGDLKQAWEHSGHTVMLAKAAKLHLEPEVALSNRPDELLDSLWTNEQKKRLWMNLFLWDNFMAMVFGRTMFIGPNDFTVKPPLDCYIPADRLHRVPVARAPSDPPTPVTERLLRYQMTLRFKEIKELEAQGPIPKDPGKVKELHRFAIDFLSTIPPCFRRSNPETRWDIEHPFMPIQRELLVYLVESFFMALHRPYVYTREESQRQVFASAIAILDSQDRLEVIVFREGQIRFDISVVFPTFDAALMLAVVLVLNPERYHASFHRPYASLKRALKRLTNLGPKMPVAQSGADILRSSIRRVLEAQSRSGFSMPDAELEVSDSPLSEISLSNPQYTTGSALPSPGNEPWQFEVDQSTMDWSRQNTEATGFDFSNLEVPMPLKELALEEFPGVFGEGFDANAWMAAGQEPQYQQMTMDVAENPLWAFLTEETTPSQYR